MNLDLNYAEAFATSAGFVQGLLAVLLWRHHQRQTRWGLRWIAAAMACSAIINLSAHRLITPFLVHGALIGAPKPVALFLLLTGFACLSALTVGLRAYTGRQRYSSLKEFLLLWPVLLLIVVLLARQFALVGDLCSVAIFLYCAWQAAQAARSERHAGHQLLCVVLCIQPLSLTAMLAYGMDAALVRYFSALPFTLVGVVLLSVSLNRLRDTLARELHARSVADAALREQQALLLTTLDLLPEPMALIDLDSAGYLDVNRRWEQVFGYRKAEVLGRTSAQLQIFEAPGLTPTLIEQLAAAGTLASIERDCRLRDGQYLTCEISASQIALHGRRAAIWLIRDISQRKRNEAEIRHLNTTLEAQVERRTAQLQTAQHELRINEQRLRAVLDTTGDGIWDWDLREDSMYNNARWAEMFGYPAQEGQHAISTFMEHIHPDDRASVQAAIGHSLSSGETYCHEHRMLQCDGSLIWVHDRGDVTERDASGQPLRMIGSVADITERKLASLALTRAKADADASNRDLQQALDHLKQTQEHLLQSEKLAALGGLVAGVAHELNTPIGNTLTTASTLLDHVRSMLVASESGTLRKTQLTDFLANSREAAELIQRNADRASQLITSFKQVAVDQTSMLRRRFTLAEVVTDAVSMVALNLKRQPIQIDLQVPDSIELDSFPGPLEQTLANLLQNAAIHGLPGRSALQIRLSARPAAERPDSHVLLEFSDDGAGMSADTAQRAFDPFFTTRFGQGGSGLGLYIVYSLVHGALGGDIVLESAPGQGCRFLLTLPLTAPEPHPERVPGGASAQH